MSAYIPMCTYTPVYTYVMYTYLYIHTTYTMKHVSFFGPHDHLIQQILVSGRQWSVLSSSIVAVVL